MSTIGQPERATQDRVIDLFQSALHYRYLGNWKDRPNNKNIEETYLRSFLKQEHQQKKYGYTDALITKALYELNKVANDLAMNLYDRNKAVYGLLRYGVKVKAEVGENTQTVWLIDWQHPLENDFALAEEVSIKGVNDKRPDLVIYVNGIALGVLELKRSTVAISEAIRQQLDNQQQSFIQPFFTTAQLLIAGSDSQGMRYGSIETSEKYYLTWKEPSTIANPLDRQLLQLCEKERFLEIIHDFIVFDAGVKKLCRPNQYFGVRAAQERVRQREGGIIWHTQGSGKSLTMVWLAKWIYENVKDARILIITDRVELDEQIEKIFKGVDEQIHRTSNGKDLLIQLNEGTSWLIGSLIHKFPGKEESDVAGFIKEVQSNLPANFKAKGDIYVFVDECHRTQSGALHEAMKIILPNAMFIGFTGTPLLKSDKEQSTRIFGSYIHTYKFDEAVKDKVVLDLRYEARDIDQYITSPQRIDQWFEAKTEGLNEASLARLKQKWGTLQKVYSSRERLDRIVADILLDMSRKPRLKSGYGNAILVASSIYEACKFYEIFVAQGFKKCAIVTSYKPAITDIKGETTGEDEVTEKLKKYEIYNKMLNGKTPEKFERDVIKQFIDEPGQMKLLIVVDKLLTGFDAPSATYLYIDKQMRDHGLFQAICRVNRLDGEDKDYGYIVDYKDLFKSLEGSIHDYTSEAFDGYEKKDVEGLLTDRVGKAKEKLNDAREAIKTLCEPVKAPRDSLDYMHYFCAQDSSDQNALRENEPKRQLLYKLTATLLRAYANIASDMSAAGYSPKEIADIKQEVETYKNVCDEIKLGSGDNQDLKMYDPAMRTLIDTYIHAQESTVLSSFDDMPLLQLIVERGASALDSLPKGLKQNKQAMAETIVNNLRRAIVNERPRNPIYYDRMSALLDTLIQDRKLRAQDYQQQLLDIVQQVQNADNTQGSYPDTINTPAKKAIYETFASYSTITNSEQLTNEIDSGIRYVKKDGWRGNRQKEKEVLREIRQQLQKEQLDDSISNTIFEIAKQQKEYT